ncbi:MAG: tetratricopeptide repeat protein [Flavobacteriales bacterium]|jgi:signal transduction histidine kinase/Tfp pilus assembly protein PilF|nr:tetratricopeptide repeat protein [Flavobacteriales bacterium]
MIPRAIPFLAVLSLCGPAAHAQQEQVDSLRAVIAAARTDTAGVNARVALCQQLRRAGDTTFMGLLDSTIALAAAAGMHAAHAQGLLERGHFLWARGRTAQAMEQLRAGEALAVQHGLLRQQADALTLIAKVLERRSELDEALDLYDRALAMYEELGLVRLQAITRSQLGVVLWRLGRLEESARMSQEGLAIYESIGDDHNIGLTLHNMGVAYEQFARYDEAIGFYRRALGHLRQSHQRKAKEMASVLASIGRLHRHLGDMDSALHYMRAGLVEIEGIGNRSDQAVGLMMYGEELEAMGRAAEAEAPLRRALHIFRDIGSRRHESRALAELAGVVALRGAPREGIGLAEEALLAAREAGTVHEALTALAVLARLHEEAGDTGRALFHHQAHAALKDSIVNVESAATLDELRTRYETEKKDRQLAEQELLLAQGQVALERRGRSLRVLGLGAAAITVILFLVVRGRRQRLLALEREKDAATARAVLDGEERERQRVARELHDGIGVLLSSALMHQQNNDGTRAAHLMEEACTEVRHIAHAMMPGSLARFGLVKALEELARNSSLKEGLHVRVQTFGLGRRLPPGTEFGLYRIAQEAVNNAIKHARARTITVDLSQEDGRIHLVVTDDGTGIDPAVVGEGSGLDHIRARAELLGGTAGWRSTPGHGTVWEVRVPLAPDPLNGQRATAPLATMASGA